jgi:hypothetical protein
MTSIDYIQRKPVIAVTIRIMINLVTKERLAGITFTKVFRFADIEFFLSYAPENQAGAEQQSIEKEATLVWSPAPAAVDGGLMFALGGEASSTSR